MLSHKRRLMSHRSPSFWPMMLCDFCSAPDPTWRYPAESFTVPDLAPSASKGDWAACDRCSALIEDEDVDRLILRASIAAHRRSRGVIATSVVRKALREVYREFFAHRLGERIPLPR